MDSLLQTLNDRQRAAVLHRDGPLLVLAGPGSGKTRVITHRIAWQVAQGGTRPERVLAITFTNRAAREMADRVAVLVPAEEQVRAGTFHRACGALLRRHGHRIGLKPDFRLLSPRESRQVLSEFVPTGRQAAGAASLAGAVSAYKNGASLAAQARACAVAPEGLAAILKRYETALRGLNALDLDDVLFLTARLLREDTVARNRCRASLDEVLVDEYQDTNPVQREILRGLQPADGRVVAVGDDDQAIYSWRQATPDAVAAFLPEFHGAAVITLEETYRSSRRILRASQSLIIHSPTHLQKHLRTENAAGERVVLFAAGDERDEAEYIAREVERTTRAGAVPFDQVGVLYRVNALSRSIEDALVRNGIPYHVQAGERFYERPEVASVVAFLRLALSESDDEAMCVLLGTLPGIGARRLEAVRASAATSGRSVWSALAQSDAADFPGAIAAGVRALMNRVREVHSRRTEPLERLLETAIGAVEPEIERLSAAAREAAEDNLAELRSIVREFRVGRGTLRAFLDRMMLATGTEPDSPGVRLMTLHAAKGLEFDTVFLPGLEEGIVPHRRSLDDPGAVEEERRLLYVGMTRARLRLHLSYSHVRLLGGQIAGGSRSRFLGEIGLEDMNLVLSERAASRPRLHAVSEGERIDHVRWGPGTVASVEGKGRDTLISILFDDGQSRRVQLYHAPLRRHEDEGAHVTAG
jgi:DNA helicase II / ATP-dependent DNA helicase PcrA